jgi:hypothetical protein
MVINLKTALTQVGPRVDPDEVGCPGEERSLLDECHEFGETSGTSFARREMPMALFVITLQS